MKENLTNIDAKTAEWLAEDTAPDFADLPWNDDDDDATACHACDDPHALLTRYFGKMVCLTCIEEMERDYLEWEAERYALAAEDNRLFYSQI